MISHSTFYTLQQFYLIYFQEIFQDSGEQKSEKSLDELRANSLEVQRVLTVHKVTQQKCVGEKQRK